MASSVTVAMFGSLHTLRKKRGLATTAEVPLPPEGREAVEIAQHLDLPVDEIEAVFVNHVVYGLDKKVKPGDAVAFIPTGLPCPHRLLLGIFDAEREKEKS